VKPAFELKPVAIEDLLNRPQVKLDREGMARLVQGRRVIVTGAGGTIGSELARQVAALGPETLVLLDNGEYALWQIDLELAETHPGVPRRAVIADIRDEARIRAVFEEWRPELVFHAAALKHVPMVEANPLEGLLTNIAGTRHVADAARAAGARAMVLISTDKAVNPTSVMGASKRLAEMYCQALDIVARGGGAGLTCITVRFGNVLGSTGSVVPLFRRQLERGGPLTVTHPDMQRYFMTVREAVGLVLEASVLGTGPDPLAGALPAAGLGGIFVLDMGKPVKIVDLARQMIRLAGLRPEQDVEIRFTGLRPGEKLFEELFHGKEPPVPTGHEGLLMATPRTADLAIVGRAIDEIATACRNGQARLALTLLSRMIPEFEHNADGSAGSARA
jgi:O-antigen biosynthesis protein WbqV